MLSIGKLGRGQEGYYLQAVARGVEDYYLADSSKLRDHLVDDRLRSA